MPERPLTPLDVNVSSSPYHLKWDRASPIALPALHYASPASWLGSSYESTPMSNWLVDAFTASPGGEAIQQAPPSPGSATDYEDRLALFFNSPRHEEIQFSAGPF
ncbi:hypothetical protein DIPPA_19829 [Diplonema papillatum]|nr:hypothetical protein DIPPA_19829 [Diplonema papillatum]